MLGHNVSQDCVLDHITSKFLVQVVDSSLLYAYGIVLIENTPKGIIWS